MSPVSEQASGKPHASVKPETSRTLDATMASGENVHQRVLPLRNARRRLCQGDLQDGEQKEKMTTIGETDEGK